MIDRAPERACSQNPCLTVGDLLIALESAGVHHFFTLNSAESQHLCRAMEQTLVVRPIDPRKEDVVCDRNAPDWPPFGKSSQAAPGEEGQGGEETEG
jgi:hypothetical protein